MDKNKHKKESPRKEYRVRDIYPDREFTKSDQIRLATEISRLLTRQKL